jgi:hypothetical protein
MRLMKSIIRIAAVISSLALLIGCVWFAQKQAAPSMMPSSKSGPLPAKMIMSGSKSYTGGTTISSGALKPNKTLPLPIQP